jgi:hypothetical protein
MKERDSSYDHKSMIFKNFNVHREIILTPDGKEENLILERIYEIQTLFPTDD